MLARILGAVVLIIIALIVIVSAYRNLSPSWEWLSRGSSTSTPGQPYSGTYYSPPPTQAPPASGGQTGGQAPAPSINPSEIPDGFTLADLSPYFKKVKITASPGYSGFYEQISLGTYLGSGEKVNVSGWQLRGNKGGQTIPQAVNFYEASGNSPESDIYLESGHTLYLYSGSSAVGRNLRLNKCIGYLENYLDFKPQLPLSCPVPDRTETEKFTGKCQDLIYSLGSCRLPPDNPQIPLNDYACQAFLSTLNYSGCVERYRRDSDFLGKEWRVWYGGKFLDERHDRVLLFDRNGKLVDAYSY